MEDFFENLFPFLMVAVVVGSRLFLMIRRRNRSRQGQSSVPPSPPKPARGFVPWEDEFRDDAPAEAAPTEAVPTEAPGEDEAFSAWDLSVSDDPPAPASPPAPPEPPSPPPLAAVSIRFAATEPLAPAPERAARSPGPSPQSLPRRRRGLSPLQQAVVWAEILGAPRGF